MRSKCGPLAGISVIYRRQFIALTARVPLKIVALDNKLKYSY